MELFQPAKVHSSALSPQAVTTHEMGIYKEGRKSFTHSHRENHARDRYGNGDANTYQVLSHERSQNVTYQDVATMRREEIPRNLFITEKEYQTYGLLGERSLSCHSHFTAPPLDSYYRDYEREHLPRHQNVIHRDVVPGQRETLHADTIYRDNKEYLAYNLADRPSAARATATSAIALDVYSKDPYYGYYQSNSSMAYQRRGEVPSSYYTSHGRRETYPLESDHSQRRGADQLDGLYSSYDVDPLYGDRRRYQAANPEPIPMPVSSRYSFAGPSYSHG